jgi:hypothetical protein
MEQHARRPVLALVIAAAAVMLAAVPAFAASLVITSAQVSSPNSVTVNVAYNCPGGGTVAPTLQAAVIDLTTLANGVGSATPICNGQTQTTPSVTVRNQLPLLHFRSGDPAMVTVTLVDGTNPPLVVTQDVTLS